MDHQPHPFDITVGRNLRIERKAKHVTQETLADAIGITFQQVQKYERGANRVSASKLAEIALFLDLPVAQFFRGLEGVEGESKATALDAFAMAPGGLELAAIFTALPPELRRNLLSVAEAISRCVPRPDRVTGPADVLAHLQLAPLSQADAARLVEMGAQH